MADNLVVHVVDDDEAVRDSLTMLLETHHFAVKPYVSAKAFLDRADSLADGCVITDIRMPDIDGLELQRRLVAMGVTIPVIVITGHGDVPMAVQALKAGALDFIEKPFDEDLLVAAVKSGLRLSAERRGSAAATADVKARLDGLTPRETEVLQGLVAGNPNKTIAYDLGMSPRTVEVHRARIMQKMQARSLSELVRLALQVPGT